jgi:molybdopterin biosynthesis enzyme MoaB
MGYNTTIVVINDALNEIETDPEFGKKLAQAIRSMGYGNNDRIDVAAGNHVNAAHVVESHHADSSVVVTVGGNLGLVRASAYGWTNTRETQTKLLKEWASTLGLEVVEKIKAVVDIQEDLEKQAV